VKIRSNAKGWSEWCWLIRPRGIKIAILTGNNPVVFGADCPDTFWSILGPYGLGRTVNGDLFFSEWELN
jgi:hypothetical protein